MIKRVQPFFVQIAYLLIWIGLAVLATLTAFQIFRTLIVFAYAIIDDPSLRPYGWTTGTINAVSRLLWLILGILWLGWVTFTEGYLREGYQNQWLTRRAIILAVILGVFYGISLLFMLLLN